MKAIETKYRGMKFRSRLEARWAVFFDTLFVPYVYEPEGYDLETRKYLPDFWLPDSQQFFEVKGIMTDIDREKINLLAVESGKDVVIGLPNAEFMIVEHHQYEEGGEDSIFWANPRDVETGIFRCSSCGCVYFSSENNTWSCRKCGTWKGKDHLIGYGNGMLWREAEFAQERFKSARFEYGETPS